jgi:hypothetical protein
MDPTEIEILRNRIERIAMIADDAGLSEVRFGVDGKATEAIASLPGAVVRETVHISETEPPIVIRAASAMLDGVSIAAQAPSRPATKAEVAAGDDAGWMQVRQEFRASKVAQ